MPYKRVGKKIYSRATGSWKLKQTCKSVENAKKVLSLLRGLAKGTIKQGNARTKLKNKQKRKADRFVKRALKVKGRGKK